jgi:hypothetical protein
VVKRTGLVLAMMVLAACAPAHLRAVGLTGSGRELPDLFLGGWDGHRLGVFDDTAVEPGVTTRAQLEQALGKLSSSLYAVVYVEKAKLDAEAAKHGLFCDAPMCLVVLEKKDGGGELSGWGATLAVFELKGPDDAPIGPVWLAGRTIRPPGPAKWERLCRSKSDAPRAIHPDGSALFPARAGLDGDGFALFGPAAEPAALKRDGFPAPSETLCDEEQVRRNAEPQPERPKLKLDPSLLQDN